jgi:hypothetical protein
VPLVAGGLGDVSARCLRHSPPWDTTCACCCPAIRRSSNLPRARDREVTVFARAASNRSLSGVPLIIWDAPTLFARTTAPYQDATGDDWNDNALHFGVLSKVALPEPASRSMAAGWALQRLADSAGTSLLALCARTPRRLAPHDPQPRLPGHLLLRPGEAAQLPPKRGLGRRGKVSFLKGGIV